MSPDGFYYRYDPDQSWATFSIQYMSAAELRYVARIIDEARLEVVR